MAVTNLSQYYTSQGKALPSISERAKAYEAAGLGKASTYVGSAAQNTSLLTYLTKPKAAPKPTTPSTPAAPTTPGAPAAAPGAAPAAPAPGVSPAAAPTVAGPQPGQTNATLDPLTREGQTALGNEYLGTMDQVQTAIKSGKTVVHVGDSAGYWIQNNTSWQNKSNDYTSRSALTAKGFQYLSSTDSVNAAKKAGKDVQLIGGSYYVVPKPKSGTSDAARQTTDSKTGATTTTNTPSTPPGQSPFEKDFANMMGDQQAPPAPDLIDTYNVYNSAYKVEDAQKQVDDAQTEIDNLDAAYVAGTHDAQNQLKPMEILRGDAAKLQQQYTEKRMLAQNKLSLATRILEGKQKMVETMVNLTDKNYENARTQYNDNYTRAFEMAKAIRSNMESDRDFNFKVKQAEGDDARANLTTFGNALVTSGKSWKDLTESQKSMVRDMELKAGIPVGTMEKFVAAKPQAKLLTTATNDNGDVTFIYANPDGTPGMTKVVKGVGNRQNVESTSTASTSVVKIDMSRSSDGGLGFTATDKSGNVVSSNAGQYAAKYKKNIFSVLNGGSSGDKEFVKGLQADLQDQASNKIPAATVLATCQSTWPHIFDGITVNEFAAMTGYVAAK
jgi:hypothetical protein